MLKVYKQLNSSFLKILLLFVFGFFLLFSGSTGFLTSSWAAEKAPDFSMKGIDGKTYTLADYKGKVVLLNFWATWCPNCVEELPSLKKLAAKLKGKDFQVLSVSIDSGEPPVKDFLAHDSLPFPVLEDFQRKVAFDLYAVFGVPATFLIDKQGGLAGRYYGARDWTSAEMVQKVQDLLK
ncbi:MAG: TlpA disulfide reductase family protein [Nitrospiraceae bacterium]|nr:TlpA disulfide reductase family protein [Nitrospiraceae bacterium]